VQVNATTPLPRAKVRAETSALTSRAGSALVSALTDRLGLTEGLTAPWAATPERCVTSPAAGHERHLPS
jgi:hypothetical protein